MFFAKYIVSVYMSFLYTKNSVSDFSPTLFIIEPLFLIVFFSGYKSNLFFRKSSLFLPKIMLEFSRKVSITYIN